MLAQEEAAMDEDEEEVQVDCACKDLHTLADFGFSDVLGRHMKITAGDFRLLIPALRCLLDSDNAKVAAFVKSNVIDAHSRMTRRSEISAEKLHAHVLNFRRALQNLRRRRLEVLR